LVGVATPKWSNLAQHKSYPNKLSFGEKYLFTMASIIALIPARSGSKGVPQKNMKLLGGRPLIEWSIAACNLVYEIQRTILSTDSKKYADKAKALGCEAPFLRPANISGDLSTDIEFVKHALDWLAANETEPDFLVHIRPTTPFRCPKLIREAINLFIKNPAATSLRSVHAMSESSYKTLEITNQGKLKRLGSHTTDLDTVNNARQTFPDTYIANGYVDVLSTKFIRENNLIHGDYVLPFITPPVQEIDTNADFEYLEFELSKHPEYVENIFGRAKNGEPFF